MAEEEIKVAVSITKGDATSKGGADAKNYDYYTISAETTKIRITNIYVLPPMKMKKFPIQGRLRGIMLLAVMLITAVIFLHPLQLQLYS